MFAPVQTDEFAFNYRLAKSVVALNKCILQSMIAASITTTSRYLCQPDQDIFRQGATDEPKSGAMWRLPVHGSTRRPHHRQAHIPTGSTGGHRSDRLRVSKLACRQKCTRLLKKWLTRSVRLSFSE